MLNKYIIDVGLDKPIKIYYYEERFIDEVILRREYRFLFNYDTVVDIGANVGSFSFFILPYAKQIFAVEPDQRGVLCMKRTIEESGIKNIAVIQNAIGGTGGIRPFKTDETNTFGGGYLSKDGKTQVETITLQELMDFQGITFIDLLKIDVEGAEKEIFQSESFRKNAYRIQTIIGEYHSNISVQQELEQAGYKFKDLGGGKFIARRI